MEKQIQGVFISKKLKTNVFGTHPPISVGIGPRKQGMENDDRLIQVPDKHSLQRKNQINVSFPCLKKNYLANFSLKK